MNGPRANGLGYEAPCRFEGECFDLVVHGEIPKSINGTFYRVGPDPQVVPKYENVVLSLDSILLLGNQLPRRWNSWRFPHQRRPCRFQESLGSNGTVCT
jgi:hypothetical protein